MKRNPLQRKKLPAIGLITNPAKSTVPGALSNCGNLLPRRPGKLSSRNGHAVQGQASAKFWQIFSYDGHVLSFNQDGTMRLGASLGSSAGSFGAYTYSTGFWDIAAVALFSTDQRPRAVVAGSNLYALTGNGIVRLSGSSGTPVPAGAPPGLCFDLIAPAAVLVTAGGFLTDQYQVAYRGCIGIRDAKDVVHLSSPTSRTIVSNATFTSGWVTTEAKNVTLRMILPSGCTANMFFQIYRSKQVPLGTQPDDDLQIVYEDYLTSLNISNGYVEIVDTYSEALPKGAYIHTSPNFARKFGDIDGENGVPPVAMDGCVFKNRLFLFNLMGYSTFPLTILGVGGTAGIQANDILHINSEIYTAKTGTPGAGEYKLVTTGSTSQNIEQTALSLVASVNKASTAVYAFYVSAPDDVPGKILFVSRTPNASRFTVVTGGVSKRTCFDPVLKSDTVFIVDLARAATTVTATCSSPATHNFRVGESVTMSIVGFPQFQVTITAVTANTWQYTDAGHAYPQIAQGAFFNYPDGDPLVYAKYDIEPNAWAYSKIREFDAFPIRNRGYVGEKGIEVGRCNALRDTIVVWTYNGGLWRIVGDSPDTFRAVLIDGTANLVAPESVVVLDDVCIGWTTKGVIEVTDTGWRILSEDIAPTLERYIAIKGFSTLQSCVFAVGNEADRYYELWVPGAHTDSCSDALVYCYATQRWGQKLSLPYLLTCGFYRRDDYKCWYGDAIDSSHGVAYKELKSLTTSDWLDEVVLTPGSPSTLTQTFSRGVSYQPFAGGDPGSLKNWQQGEAQFESSLPSLLSIVALNEGGLGTNDSVSPADVSGVVIRFWIDLTAQGCRLTVTISASTQDDFEFLGIELWWEEFGNEVMRT